MQTVTGLFDNYDDASNAVGELEATGIPHSDISIVSNNADNRHDLDGSKAMTHHHCGKRALSRG